MSLQIPSRSRLPIAFFVFAAACLPAAAEAQAVNEQPSIKVKFGDLDLNTDAGRRELLTRLKKGADRVCREQALFFGAYPHDYSACYRATLATAVDKVHHEQLSALFAATSRPTAR
jgi:UrcA family protein